MTEEQLQSEIARKFSELYPDRAGQLFHVPNERNNKIQAFKAKAIGIYPGVADYIYFSESWMVAIELKVKGSRHKVSHLKKQLEWSKVWEREGSHWRLCMTCEDAISCCNGDLKGMTINDVEEKLRQVKTKTIKF